MSTEPGSEERHFRSPGTLRVGQREVKEREKESEGGGRGGCHARNGYLKIWLCLTSRNIFTCCNMMRPLKVTHEQTKESHQFMWSIWYNASLVIGISQNDCRVISAAFLLPTTQTVKMREKKIICNINHLCDYNPCYSMCLNTLRHSVRLLMGILW